MPRQVGFHVYSVRVREKYARDYVTLSAVNNHDLLEVLHSGLRALRNAQANNEEAERVVSLRRIHLEGRQITGLIEAGHYGASANIVHSTTGQTVHMQATEEASMLPFFFRMVIPNGRDRGLLILQRDNRIQSKGAFKNLIDPLIKRINPNFVCELDPIMNKETFEHLVGEGQIQQLKFIKLGITQDFADEYEHGRDETEGSMEVIVKAKRGRQLPMKRRLVEWMTAQNNVRDMFTLPGMNFDFDTVKADLRIGRNKRTVDFGRRMNTPIIDLTANVQFERRTGHPTYASLQQATLELANDEMFDEYGE